MICINLTLCPQYTTLQYTECTIFLYMICEIHTSLKISAPDAIHLFCVILIFYVHHVLYSLHTTWHCFVTSLSLSIYNKIIYIESHIKRLFCTDIQYIRHTNGQIISIQ